MSLTPEQERAEREAFEQAKATDDLIDWGDWHAWSVRAERAASEREQLAPYVQHSNACHIRSGSPLPCDCGLDAILAPREKGGAA